MSETSRRIPWGTLLKVVVIVAATAYLIGTGKLQWSRLALGPQTAPMLLAGAGMVLATMLLSFVRYRILLGAAGIGLGLGATIRIGFIGAFFNTFMLGGMGGDVVKLAYVLRATPRKAGAVASIMVDRVLGLLGLVALGGVALLLAWEEVLATPTLHQLTLWVFGVLGAAGFASLTGFVSLARGRRTAGALWAGAVLLLAAGAWMALRGAELRLGATPDAPAEALLRGRALVAMGAAALAALGSLLLLPSCQPGRRLERTLRRLPLGGKLASLIEAIIFYRNHAGALLASFLLSILLQALGLLSFFFISRALTLDPAPTLRHIFFATPPALVANALPISFGGLGVGEASYEGLLRLCRVGGAPVEGGAEIFLVWRAWLVALGLIGLPFYLRGKKEIDAAEAAYREEEAEAEAALDRVTHAGDADPAADADGAAEAGAPEAGAEGGR